MDELPQLGEAKSVAQLNRIQAVMREYLEVIRVSSISLTEIIEHTMSFSKVNVSHHLAH